MRVEQSSTLAIAGTRSALALDQPSLEHALEFAFRRENVSDDQGVLWTVLQRLRPSRAVEQVFPANGLEN
jgi:hypothetical protein